MKVKNKYQKSIQERIYDIVSYLIVLIIAFSVYNILESNGISSWIRILVVIVILRVGQNVSEKLYLRMLKLRNKQAKNNKIDEKG